MTPREFVIEWLQNNLGADACNEAFHDAFHERFGGKRKQYLWGAMPVHKAMRLLSKMHREGVLERGRTKLGMWDHPGMPRWVYWYRLKPLLPNWNHVDCDCSACLPPTY